MAKFNGAIASSEHNPPTLPTSFIDSSEHNPPTLPTFYIDSSEHNPPTLPTFYIDSSEHNPPTLPTFFAANGGGGDNGNSPNSEDSSINNQQTTSDTTAGRPRGRPRGSKNKTKPSVAITKDNDSTVKPVILEISPGSDVIENIINFARERHVGINIISASGSVMFGRGPFVLLSLSGLFIADYTSSFGVTLAAAGAQVFGGIVRGKLVAATQVIVVAATFEAARTSFHKLPYEGGDNQAQQTNPSQFNFQIPPRFHVP